MSKVVCDICGTSYPETSAQCPICGCVKPMDTNAVIDKEASNSGTYTYVKGGRFSKKNVQKKAGGIYQFPEQTQQSPKESNKSNKNHFLLIPVVAIFLAILVACAFIFRDVYSDFLLPNSVSTNEAAENLNDATNDGTSNNATSPTESGQNTSISCTAIHISPEVVTLKFEQQQVTLDVTYTPENTTDSLSYISDNPGVVTVDNTGKLTAVSEGEATITVMCGSAKALCHVSCIFSDETVEIPVTKLKLNRTDFSLFYAGDNWHLYNGDIPVTEITWYSDNEDVAIVEFGRVVAVGEGVTYVHAEYDGEKESCIVRVKFRDHN